MRCTYDQCDHEAVVLMPQINYATNDDSPTITFRPVCVHDAPDWWSGSDPADAIPWGLDINSGAPVVVPQRD